jgi:hypothetical protein
MSVDRAAIGASAALQQLLIAAAFDRWSLGANSARWPKTAARKDDCVSPFAWYISCTDAAS